MRIQVKELSPEWVERSESKPFEWLGDALAGSQGRAAPHGTVEIKVRASAFGGNVLIRGELHAPVILVCSRCAEEWLEPQEVHFEQVMAPAKPARGEDESEVELTDEDIAYTPYEGETIDLDPILREQVILATPDYPLCRPDCKGLCQRCGANLNETTCACAAEEPVDPRLAPLRNLKLSK